MKNCLAIQYTWSYLVYVTGNRHTKSFNIDIPVYILDGSNGTTDVIDLATKQKVRASVEYIPATDIRTIENKLGNRKYYIPRPDLYMLLDSNSKKIMRYAQTEPIRIMTLDIETYLSSGDIFNPINNPIIAIGLKLGDEEPFVISRYDESLQDYYILQTFISYVQEYDPDIIMVYNASYDIPYIIVRMLQNGIDPNILSRVKNGFAIKNKNPNEAFEYLKKIITKFAGLRDIFLGRIIYDLYLDIMKDQSLTGKVKNRKLKTIAEYYGFEYKELDYKRFLDPNIINSQELIDYNRSDVNITHSIGSNIYMPVAQSKSELVNIPIGNILNCQPSYIPAVIGIRETNKRNIIPFERNLERYNSYESLMYRETNRSPLDNYEIPINEENNGVDIIDINDNLEIKDLTDSESDTIDTTFEAAIVYQSDKNVGFIPKVYKLDFKSYYPSTIMTLNLGPDTTKLVEFRDKRENVPLQVEHRKNITRLYIQDNSYNKEVVIDIDNSVTSYYKELLLKFKQLRSKKKKELQKLIESGAPSGDIAKLDAFQLAIKVLMNIFFGESGNKYSLYGDLAVAICIVGFCRDVTNYVCENIIGYENVIEIDTDGVYVTKDIDANSVNKKMNEYVKTKYGIDESFLEMDKEEYGSGYFIRKKTYILEHLDGTIETKGSALKGSNKPKLFDVAKDYLIDQIMHKKNTDYYDILNHISDLSIYEWPHDFIVTSKAKDINTYAKTSHIYRVINQCSKYMKINPGDTLEYVYTTNGIKPVNAITKNDKYDYKKYITYINSLIDVFGLKKFLSGQINLFD